MTTDLASTLQLCFYMIILELGQSTQTCTVYGELGRFPLAVKAKTRMLNFGFKLVNINNKDKFSYIMYKFLYDKYHAGMYKSPVLSGVETILNEIGLNDKTSFT